MIEAGWTRLRSFWRPSVRQEVDDELAFHLEERVEQFVAEGMSRSDAERAARQQLGDIQSIRKNLTVLGAQRQRQSWMHDLTRDVTTDLRRAVHTLRTHRASNLAAVVILAVGIGATTTMFSVIDAVLLRPLPYGHSDRLGIIEQDLRTRQTVDVPLAPGDIPDIRRGATLFSGIAALSTIANTPYAAPGASPEPLAYAAATTNVFDVLELPVILGRNFFAADGAPNPPRPMAKADLDTLTGPRPLSRPHVAILGYRYWQRRFGGDSSVVGSTLIGPFGATRIIGIASPRAELFFPSSAGVLQTPDIWDAVQLDLDAATRQNGSLRLIARLAPHATIAAGRAQIDSIGALLRDRSPLRRTAGAVLAFEPMQDHLVAAVRGPLLALGGATVLVLLVACANVANLLLVRGAHRERELAVRAAIGGTRWRIVRQLLSESLVLSLLSGVGGLLIAFGLVSLLTRVAPANIPRLDTVRIGVPGLAFALLAAFASTLVFGLMPAMRATAPRVAEALRAGTLPSFAITRLQATVVVSEVALSFVLLVGCGLMARSFVAVMRADLGFDPHGVMTFSLSNRNFRTPAQRLAIARELRDSLAAIPGVDAVTFASALPLDGRSRMIRWGPESARTDSTRYREGTPSAVFANYFAVMRTPLLAGRSFNDADDLAAARVVVIDDLLAREAFGDEPAVGGTLLIRVSADTVEPYSVIGVVRHQRRSTIVGRESPAMYLPYARAAPLDGRWAIRTSGDTLLLSPNVRAAIRAVRPSIVVNELRPLSDYVDRATASTRSALLMLGFFATITAILATVGLYSVLSTIVRQRTAEIGVRVAFGAPPSSIFAFVIGRGVKLGVVGVLAGLALALVAARLTEGLVVGVTVTDPVTFAVAGAVFLGLTAIACWIPARRAAALDPVVALRDT